MQLIIPRESISGAARCMLLKGLKGLGQIGQQRCAKELSDKAFMLGHCGSQGAFEKRRSQK